MTRAIFFDLDGTLLDSRKKIPDSACKALMECREHGISLCVATARPPILEKMLGWNSKEQNLFLGGVYCNGACEKIGARLSYHFISRSVVERVIGEVRQYNGLNIALQMKEEKHAFRYPLAEQAWGPWGIDPEDVLPLEEADWGETVKMLVFYENLIDSVTLLPKRLIEDIEKTCGHQAKIYHTDQGKLLQIGNCRVSKYGGIQAVCREMGWEAEEIVVFGDDYNDEEMLRGFPRSVAMGNAPQAIKDIAGHVTKSNEEDGIAYAIRAWILSDRW